MTTGVGMAKLNKEVVRGDKVWSLDIGAELELGPRTFNNLGFLSSLHWLAMQTGRGH